MSNDRLSPRQLSVAVLTGGLSAGAAAAGQADWWWLLALIPAGMGLGWLLLRRVGGRPLHPVLKILYGGWAVVLLSDVLGRAAGRVQTASGGERDRVWLLVLLALPLLWMGWGKAVAFFRAAEIFWLAAGVTAVAVLLLGAPRMVWSWTLESAGNWGRSLAAGGL